MKKTPLVENVAQAIQETFLARIQTYSKTQDGKIINQEVPAGRLHDLSLVVILLAGEHVHITFKVFFDHKECEELINKIYTQKPRSGDLRNLVTDFFKEVSNLTAGHMKWLFENSKVDCNISLPIALRGFDEFFFNKVKDNSSFEDSWAIAFPSGTVHFSNIISLDSSLKDIDLTISDQAGEIEFF